MYRIRTIILKSTIIRCNCFGLIFAEGGYITRAIGLPFVMFVDHCLRWKCAGDTNFQSGSGVFILGLGVFELRLDSVSEWY